MKGVAILGSTGSIGESTLDVVERHRDRYRVVALGARTNDQKLLKQVLRHEPDYAVLVDAAAAARLESALASAGSRTRVLAGADALVHVATLVATDYVMAAIVGAAGLASTLAAAHAGKRVLLANKESLVMAGPLLIGAVRQGGGVLLPIDSEHNAIFQCLPPGKDGRGGVRRIVLTASGGPFIDADLATLRAATPEQACAHPNWVMGRKISVDSATLMNKGLELIEACLLFDMEPEDVDVVLHRQSIVHSLVEYVDGSVIAELGTPDMRTPIAHALGWPERIASGVQFLDLVRVGRLDFEAPDTERFRCLALGQEAARRRGLAPAVLNAANEVAVDAFLEGRLNFLAIPEVIETVMMKGPGGPVRSLQDVLEADAEARVRAREAIA